MSGRRLLLVDDDPVLAEAAARWLARDGWQVERAATAAATRGALARGLPDAVVLDFVLPDGDGVELLQHIRAAGFAGPILALTGAASETILEALVRAGANHVLDKQGLTRGALLDALDLASAAEAYPARPRAPRAPLAPAEAPLVARVGRALVVDDVSTTRRLVRAHLESAGWRVDEAATAAEGVRLASSCVHDVIVLDHLLPDVDGLGAFQELRRRGCEAPVVVLTAHADEGVATEFAMAGAADLLAKEGLTREALLGAIARAMEATGALRAR